LMILGRRPRKVCFSFSLTSLTTRAHADIETLQMCLQLCVGECTHRINAHAHTHS
jgi:hypothetical protein